MNESYWVECVECSLNGWWDPSEGVVDHSATYSFSIDDPLCVVKLPL